MNYLNPSAPIWGQAFRPMFLLGALFSAIAMAIWGGSLLALQLGHYSSALPNYGTHQGVFWHSHEMLFGFAAAIIAGFLLTAVQNWTGQRATNGRPLLILTLVWLAARILMLCGSLVPWWLTAAVDMAFLPLVAWFFFRLLHSVKQKRNYFFSVVMLFMTFANGVMHYGNALGERELILWGGHAVSLMIVLFITVVGGRVMPMFTANGTMTPRVANIEWLDKLTLGSTWLLVFLFITTLESYLPTLAMALICLVAAVAQAMRVGRLKIQRTLKVPLLWSLHLAYWFIPLGLLMLCGHYIEVALSDTATAHYFLFSTALHALTVGGIGGMIIAMISRVSLGHSGRPLVANKTLAIAFALLLIAAVIRSVLVALAPSSLLLLSALSALIWILPFVIFVVLYYPILTTPRPDGRAG